MITAWRITSTRLARTALEGHGAAKYPGRWNPSGIRAVYTAESRSLAAFENLVHAEDKELLVSVSWSMIPLSFDEALVHAPQRLPADWQVSPAPDSTRKFGGDWLAKAISAVLRVPSVVTLGEFCYILNPVHPDFAKIAVGDAESFSYDGRVA